MFCCRVKACQFKGELHLHRWLGLVWRLGTRPFPALGGVPGPRLDDFRAVTVVMCLAQRSLLLHVAPPFPLVPDKAVLRHIQGVEGGNKHTTLVGKRLGYPERHQSVVELRRDRRDEPTAVRLAKPLLGAYSRLERWTSRFRLLRSVRLEGASFCTFGGPVLNSSSGVMMPSFLKRNRKASVVQSAYC